MKTRQQRKAIYLQLAKEFEEGKQQFGFCKTFSIYDIKESIAEFPELFIAFTTLDNDKKLIPIYKREKERINYYGEISYLFYDKKGQNIRATLLCLAACLTDK